MYTNLIDLLKKEIDEYEDNIKLLSNKIREVKDLYDVIKPNGKRIAIENSTLLTEKWLFEKLMAVIKKSNYIAIERMVHNKIEYEKYLKETSLTLDKLGLSREKIYSDPFITYAQKFLSTEEYKKFISIKETDEKLKQLDNDIVWYIYDMIIEMYEKLFKEKEDKKLLKKKLEYAYKAIKRNEKLLPREIATITNLINDNSNDEKDACYLLSELNKYIDKTNIKRENIDKAKKIKHKTKVYTDMDRVDVINENESENDNLYINYVEFLKSFNSFDDIGKFLDSFGNIEFVKKNIYKILNILTDNEEDTSLKEFLISYISSIDVDITSKEEVNRDEIIVLFYGFLDGKNRILNDIEKNNIPKEYYNDILKGINMIKTDGAKSKRESFADIKKLFKLRINDIRIAFKRLDNNVYIILGVFCKKDNKGYDIVKTSKKRNYSFSEIENSIINAHNINELWNDYLEKNNKMEDEINSILVSKKKVCRR